MTDNHENLKFKVLGLFEVSASGKYAIVAALIAFLAYLISNGLGLF